MAEPDTERVADSVEVFCRNGYISGVFDRVGFEKRYGVYEQRSSKSRESDQKMYLYFYDAMWRISRNLWSEECEARVVNWTLSPEHITDPWKIKSGDDFVLDRSLRITKWKGKGSFDLELLVTDTVDIAEDSSGAITTGLHTGDSIKVKILGGAIYNYTAVTNKRMEQMTMQEGAFKKAYRAQDIETDRIFVLKVVCREGVKLAEEIETHEAAINYADKFNRSGISPIHIYFCAPVLAKVVRYRGFDDRFEDSVDVLLDPLMKGRFQKFAWNKKDVGLFETCETFMHFTYHESGGKEVIWDLQGVSDPEGKNYLMTDPFPITGLKKAKEKIDECHPWCNKLCRKFKIHKGNLSTL